MFKKRKVKKYVDLMFNLATLTATLPKHMLLFFYEVRMELLFFFFFLVDCSALRKMNQNVREKSLDLFVKRLANELGGRKTKKKAELICLERVNSYYRIIRNANSMSDFLKSASEYIEAMALYSNEKKQICEAQVEQLDNVRSEFSYVRHGKLAEPIAMSIYRNARLFLADCF